MRQLTTFLPPFLLPNKHLKLDEDERIECSIAYTPDIISKYVSSHAQRISSI